LELDHYLEALARKPGAPPGATALGQARAAGTFTSSSLGLENGLIFRRAAEKLPA
jgi:hypothetical protein